MAIKKKYQGQALGRGLDALLQTEVIQTNGSSNLQEVRMDDIQPNPNQPRREFDDDSLQELANSIRQIGLVQPITLRDMGDGTYTIIAGERRWRASQRVGLVTIPAYIRTVDDENMLEMALVENIQREDLNAIEVALAYQNLIEGHNLTQDQLSEKVGKNRATIANYLRLLKLPASVQVALRNKEIDMGHARALLSVSDPKAQLKVFSEMKKGRLSVRQIENMAKQLSEGGSVKTKTGTRIRQKGSNLSADYNLLREGLRKIFKTKVEMTCSESGKGKISIPFANETELERIIEMFDKLRN
ncbi:MAG: ParB/RepB/Spo0J family partition protein [Bacteroidaceae bacterium]|jgi:ParB-like partition proteins|nr:ParB/RepB/Spo0J family partition protein [Bacteroidaceae bacterium]MBQ5938402.1 ParB/RepB/Spo0J family partition protein [Bacteroidaceae bacterium]MBQ6226814.1 ParB/RepB/Spo0J family partition protein [Bacteroidaceae bacterium]